MQASGKFDVNMTPQTSDQIDVGRLTIEKTYRGEMQGSGKGQMLSKRTSVPGSAGYVALEHFSGNVNGVAGGFTLQHFGLMNKGESQLQVTIIPDSGTEGLAGISGALKIDMKDGEHFYVLEYEISE